MVLLPPTPLTMPLGLVRTLHKRIKEIAGGVPSALQNLAQFVQCSALYIAHRFGCHANLCCDFMKGMFKANIALLHGCHHQKNVDGEILGLA